MKKSVSKDGNYAFVTIKEFAKILEENPEKEIGFTDDSNDDGDEDFEPTGWYGMMYTGMFDGDTLLMGYYGGGVVDFCSSSNYEYENYEYNICAMLEDIIHKNIGELCEVVCIDLDDLKKGE